MNAFLVDKLNVIIITFFFAFLIHAHIAIADDRMVGTVHHVNILNFSTPEEEKKTADVSQTPTVPITVNDVQYKENTRLSLQQRDKLASYGLLKSAREGSLGKDLWAGSDREFILSLAKAVPGLAPFRALQRSMDRISLSVIDPIYFQKNRSKINSTDTLYALKIEKLIESGSFKHAADLYAKNKDIPYSEKLAREGILSLLFSGQTALACLEVKSINNTHINIEFWTPLQDFCNLYLLIHAQQDIDSNKYKEKDEPNLLIDSLLDKDFLFTINSYNDFNELSVLELAVISSLKKLDLSNFKTISDDDVLLPSHIKLSLEHTSLPLSTRYTLLTKAIELGLIETEQLTQFYETIDFSKPTENKFTKESLSKAVNNLPKWQQLAFLYQAASNAAKGSERDDIISLALSHKDSHNLVSLLPFIDFLSDSQINRFDHHIWPLIFTLFAITDETIPSEWIDSFIQYYSENANIFEMPLLYYLAFSYNEELISSLRNALDTEDFEELPTDNRHDFMQLLAVKLDKIVKLHNYRPAEYEKQIDLTNYDDYVMQSDSLIEHLVTAKRERRLGEVVLLSSAVLTDMKKNQVKPEALIEVLFGLETVGLTKEARTLSAEILLASEK